MFWSFDVFNQFCVNFNNISKALTNNNKIYLEINEKEVVKVLSIFGAPHVFLGSTLTINTSEEAQYSSNLPGSTLTLNSGEWEQLISNLPLIQLELRELFYEEDLIKQYLCGGFQSPSPHIFNRLICEINRINGCGS